MVGASVPAFVQLEYIKYLKIEKCNKIILQGNIVSFILNARTHTLTYFKAQIDCFSLFLWILTVYHTLR